jgi:hypothetical protein
MWIYAPHMAKIELPREDTGIRMAMGKVEIVLVPYPIRKLSAMPDVTRTLTLVLG